VGGRTLFAPSVCLDVVCLVALAMALRRGAGELFGVGEDDLLARTCLYKAMVYSLGHRPWSRVFALDDVLARRLLEGPNDRLWCGALQVFWERVDAVAMNRYDNKVMLLLRLLGYWQAEDLVDVFPGYAELDIAAGAYGSNAAVLLVQELQGELLALRNREADSGICPPCFRCAAD
jgi:hypothetical protein